MTEEVTILKSAVLLQPSNEHHDTEPFIGSIIYIVDESEEQYRVVLSWYRPTIWLEKEKARIIHCAESGNGECSGTNMLNKCFWYNSETGKKEVLYLCDTHAKGSYCLRCGENYRETGQLDAKIYCDDCYEEVIEEILDEDDFEEEYY